MKPSQCTESFWETTIPLHPTHYIPWLSLSGLASRSRPKPLSARSVAIRRKYLGDITVNQSLAYSISHLAGLIRANGKLTEAEAMNREAIPMWRKLMGNEHPYVADSLQSLAEVLRDQGKLAEAEMHLREALAITDEGIGRR